MSRLTTEAEFWERATRPSADACWLWTRATDENGYGILSWRGRFNRAHVVAYELTHGPVPDGLEIDHTCRAPSCINPAHLEAVTHRENMLRRPRQTHCKAGHELFESHPSRPGARFCRICRNARARERKRQRKLSA